VSGPANPLFEGWPFPPRPPLPFFPTLFFFDFFSPTGLPLLIDMGERQ